MDNKIARALRTSRRRYQDGGGLPFTSDTSDKQAKAASDPHRYERFVEPVAKGVQWLKEMVKAPFDMARDAREAGGYSQLDPSEVGRAGLNTGLATLAPAAGLATGALPKGSGFVLMSGAGPTDKKGIRAYHGSPHDFDRFSMDKIGTGEGAQAYGHGLYFAESEGVAKSYRDSLSQDGLGVVARGRLRQFDGDVDKTLEYMRGNNRPNEAEALAQIETLKATGMNPGRMYEVRIDADPNDFLDWDKPLSQQSEKVRGAILSRYGAKDADALDAARVGYRRAYDDWMSRPENVTPQQEAALERAVAAASQRLNELQGIPDSIRGSSVYNKLASDKPYSAAVEALREAGIPGIKYLDAGSRGAGDGSRNYVLFRDDIINIVRKYGMAAAVSMYGADAVNNAMQDAGNL